MACPYVQLVCDGIDVEVNTIKEARWRSLLHAYRMKDFCIRSIFTPWSAVHYHEGYRNSVIIPRKMSIFTNNDGSKKSLIESIYIYYVAFPMLLISEFLIYVRSSYINEGENTSFRNIRFSEHAKNVFI